LLLFTVPAHVTTLVELLKRDLRRIHPVAHVSDPHVPGEETGRSLMPNGVYTHEITCKWVEPTGQKGRAAGAQPITVWIHFNAELVVMETCVHGWAPPV